MLFKYPIWLLCFFSCLNSMEKNPAIYDWNIFKTVLERRAKRAEYMFACRDTVTASILMENAFNDCCAFNVVDQESKQDQLKCSSALALRAGLFAQANYDNEKAVSFFQYAADAFPESVISCEGAYCLGASYLEKNNLELAEKHLHAACEKWLSELDKGPILFSLGELYQKKGELAQAKKFYQECLDEAQDYDVQRLAEGALQLLEGTVCDANVSRNKR